MSSRRFTFATVEKIAAALDVPVLSLFGVGTDGQLKSERGKLLARIQQSMAGMTDEQMARAANLLDAFMGR